MIDIHTRFRLCARFRCEAVPDQVTFLISESATILLRTRSYRHLLALIDGRRTVGNIIDESSGTVPAASVFYALEKLREAGYIEAVPQSERASFTDIKPNLAFWQNVYPNADGAVIRGKIDTSNIAVFALGSADPAPLLQQLRGMGVRSTLHDHTSIIDMSYRSSSPSDTERKDIRSADAWVVVTDDYLRDELAIINQYAVQLGRPWLLGKTVGVDCWIGPFFVPDSSGCWACLAHRLRGHRKVDSYLRRHLQTPGPFSPPPAMLPSWSSVAHSMMATEVVKWLADANAPSLHNRVVTIHANTLRTRDHTLVRRPQCAACGKTHTHAPPLSMDFSDDVAVDLAADLSAFWRTALSHRGDKRFIRDGGHRSQHPAETWRRLAHHISPITGIVSILEDPSRSMGGTGPAHGSGNGVGDGAHADQRGEVYDERPPGIAVYATDHNFVHMNEDLYFFRETLRARSGGKGKTPVQAKTSALCETIERYSGVFQGDEPRRMASMVDLGEAAVHPNDCMLFSEKQYRERAKWAARQSRYNAVPAPFNVEQKVEWTPVWSLSSSRVRYLPTEYCYYGYRPPVAAEQSGFARADSNGCAAGSTRAEAVLQGVFELVERDAVAIWWYNRLRCPAVDIMSFRDPDIGRIADYHGSLGRKLYVLDITSDIAMPTFAALSGAEGNEQENIIFGFGCHFSPDVALMRALTELSQSLPYVRHGTAHLEQAGYQHDREALDWWHHAKFAEEQYLCPDTEQAPRTRAEFNDMSSSDIGTDIERCRTLLEQRGLEMLLLDQTRPDTDLCVVKVFVPGLRHFWARFAPGRLYDVPVTAKQIHSPVAEFDLNPYCVYF